MHQLFQKILSVNINLKSIKGHNSVEKFGKIRCISHNMDHIYINVLTKFYQNPFIISKDQFVLKILNGNKILTSSRAITQLKNNKK